MEKCICDTYITCYMEYRYLRRFAGPGGDYYYRVSDGTIEYALMQHHSNRRNHATMFIERNTWHTTKNGRGWCDGEGVLRWEHEKDDLSSWFCSDIPLKTIQEECTDIPLETIHEEPESITTLNAEIKVILCVVCMVAVIFCAFCMWRCRQKKTHARTDRIRVVNSHKG